MLLLLLRPKFSAIGRTYGETYASKDAGSNPLRYTGFEFEKGCCVN